MSWSFWSRLGATRGFSKATQAGRGDRAFAGSEYPGTARADCAMAGSWNRSLVLDLTFAWKPMTPFSFLWFAPVQCLYGIDDAAGLTLEISFIAAEPIEREVWQIREAQK